MSPRTSTGQVHDASLQGHRLKDWCSPSQKANFFFQEWPWNKYQKTLFEHLSLDSQSYQEKLCRQSLNTNIKGKKVNCAQRKTINLENWWRVDRREKDRMPGICASGFSELWRTGGTQAGMQTNVVCCCVLASEGSAAWKAKVEQSKNRRQAKLLPQQMDQGGKNATTAGNAFIRRRRREQLGGLINIRLLGMEMGSDNLTPRLLPLSNYLLSWHMSELRNDATLTCSPTSAPYSKCRVSQLKGNRSKVTCTCRTKTSGPQSPGPPVPLWGLQKSNTELQSYFDIGSHIRNGNSSDALNLWCLSPQSV